MSDEGLKQSAAALGLDMTRFNACVDTHKYKDRVEMDIRDGNDAGVSGTPAFFINGRMLTGAQPFDAFKRIIDEELELKTVASGFSRTSDVRLKADATGEGPQAGYRRNRRPVTIDATIASALATRQPSAMIMWSPRSRVIGPKAVAVRYPPMNPPMCA